MKYTELSFQELKSEYASVKASYDAFLSQKLSLNIARGNPSVQQLDLSTEMLHTLDDGNFVCDGFDVRNYGCMDGLPSCKALFAELLDVSSDNVIIYNTSSLTNMYDLIALAYTNGLKDSPRPWAQEEKVKFLCPCPGYDRHFNVTKSFGAELIPVPMLFDGPDMDAVEELVKDPAVKGIWCVPKYSNPTGIIFSDEVCRRLASMETAAPDFTIMWDNAYCIHEFDGEFVPFVEMLSLCASFGHANRVYEFASFSKVTYAGASVSCMASSAENLTHFKSLMTFRMICGNKVAQLMHVRFLKNKENTLALMKKHGALLKPKFDGILETLKGLEEYGIASWSEPKGGYFISLNGYPHTAKRTFELCKAAGLTMTGAGATFPYGKDPEDRNLRIAPSFAPPETVAQAAGVLCVSLRLAALEQIAKERFGEALN